MTGAPRFQKLDKFLLSASIAISILLLVVAVFLWSFLSYFETIGALIFALLLIISLAVCSLMLLYRLFSGRVYSVLPLIFGAACILLYFNTVNSDIPIHVDFNAKMNQRISIVGRIEAGVIKPNDPSHPGLVKLSFPDSLAAEDGDVAVEDDSNYVLVVFYMREELNTWSGFVYRSDNKLPYGRQILKLRQHWFWVTY